MALPGKNTNMAHWRIVPPIYSCYFFYFIEFFHGLFVFSHMKLDRATFDHTMSEANRKENATPSLQTAQRVGESCRHRS